MVQSLELAVGSAVGNEELGPGMSQDVILWDPV